MKLLVIEDNPRLAIKMKQQLQKWYLVEVVHTGDAALQLLTESDFGCILLDLGLPDAHGSEICSRIRSISLSVPILIVTGEDTLESRVKLLNTGADDYITKPFQLAELRARINALTRRSFRAATNDTITIGDLTIQPGNRTVQRAGVPITLRKKEFNILEYLMRNAGHVASRQTIINHAWSSVNPTWTGSVDVHIKQLRDKVDKPFAYPLIKTSYGVGYMIELPQADNKKKGIQ